MSGATSASGVRKGYPISVGYPFFGFHDRGIRPFRLLFCSPFLFVLFRSPCFVWDVSFVLFRSFFFVCPFPILLSDRPFHSFFPFAFLFALFPIVLFCSPFFVSPFSSGMCRSNALRVPCAACRAYAFSLLSSVGWCSNRCMIRSESDRLDRFMFYPVRCWVQSVSACFLFRFFISLTSSKIHRSDKACRFRSLMRGCMYLGMRPTVLSSGVPSRFVEGELRPHFGPSMFFCRHGVASLGRICETRMGGYRSGIVLW